MKFKFLTISLLMTSFLAVSVGAQSNRRLRGERIPESIREKIHEMQINEQKKDFDKLLERSELVAKLSSEIETSYIENKKLTSKDRAKLKNVDRLLKKIRQELRASKTDRTEKPPRTIVLAIENLRENTSKLFEEVKKTTRHSVSVMAIQSSNTVLRIVKFLRFGKQ